MKTATTILLLLALCAVAQAQDKPADKLTLKLKSGEEFEGALKKATEDGVSIDLGDGLVLFVRWAFVRGDKHLDLRKQATDYTKLASVVKLADFCHENALDQEEAFVLAAGLRLEPANKVLRDRLAKLPRPEGLEIPGEPGKEPQPEPEPKPEPEQPKDPVPLPPPTRTTFKVYIEMVNEDAAALTWLTDEFNKMKYQIGTKADHEMHLKVTLDFTLTANPKFMGAELYAIYDGKLKYELFRKAEKKSFGTGNSESKQVRRDTKVEALNSCRKELLQDAFPAIHRDLEKQR
ncbi:MAG: hypothetical protein KF754_07365 [Planctomycetes bacterium]|nr:hypothetical protein [Planctomycetota bacterium]